LAVEDTQNTDLNTEVAELQGENDDLTNLLKGNNFFFYNNLAMTDRIAALEVNVGIPPYVPGLEVETDGLEAPMPKFEEVDPVVQAQDQARVENNIDALCQEDKWQNSPSRVKVYPGYDEAPANLIKPKHVVPSEYDSHTPKPSVLLVSGAPGVDTRTYCEHICKKYGFVYLKTSEV
jgi:hypothetical protein